MDMSRIIVMGIIIILQEEQREEKQTSPITNLRGALPDAFGSGASPRFATIVSRSLKCKSRWKSHHPGVLQIPDKRAHTMLSAGEAKRRNSSKRNCIVSTLAVVIVTLVNRSITLSLNTPVLNRAEFLTKD